MESVTAEAVGHGPAGGAVKGLGAGNLHGDGRVGQSGKRCAGRVRSRALHGVALAVSAKLGNARNRPTRPTMLSGESQCVVWAGRVAA